MSPTAHLLALTLALSALLPRPASGQEGSVGGGVVGGLSGGAAALWAFFPYTGCPLVTIGGEQPADACDAGSVAAALGGTAVGAWVGGTDGARGYGMGLGLVAGVGVGWLLSQVTDTPRWLDATLMLVGVAAGGLLNGS